MILIDGSQGEGGGQILRSSLGLSMVTGRSFRIEKIRAGRAKPGLMRQHLTAVQAAAQICGADVEGDAIGSQSLTFVPSKVKAGEYRFSIGTAGSTTLVLQTILPALLRADGPTHVTLEGGTHNPFAPPFPFLQQAFAPLLAKMGAKLTLELDRPGFYPAGGGRFTALVQPCDVLTPISLIERGAVMHRCCTAIVANLPGEIAKREVCEVGRLLGWTGDELRIRDLKDCGPGNIVVLEVASEHVTEVFVGFGEKGVLAEQVASGAAEDVRDYLTADVPVGRHLADQLLIPLALAGAGEFLTLAPTAHTTTNADIVSRFLDVRIVIEQREGTRYHVCVRS